MQQMHADMVDHDAHFEGDSPFLTVNLTLPSNRYYVDVGVILNTQLTFTDHVDAVVKRGNRSFDAVF